MENLEWPKVALEELTWEDECQEYELLGESSPNEPTLQGIETPLMKHP